MKKIVVSLLLLASVTLGSTANFAKASGEEDKEFLTQWGLADSMALMICEKQSACEHKQWAQAAIDQCTNTVRDAVICARKDFDCSDAKQSKITVPSSEAAAAVVTDMACPRNKRYLEAVMSVLEKPVQLIGRR